MEKNSVSNEFKGHLAHAGTNINALERRLGLKKWALGRRLSNGTITYTLAQEIARLVGYEIRWVRK